MYTQEELQTINDSVDQIYELVDTGMDHEIALNKVIEENNLSDRVIDALCCYGFNF